MTGLAPENAALLASARTLAADGVTAEVVSVFRRSGVDSILIKGPTLAAWLYRGGPVRYYADSDLVVAPQHYKLAKRLLADLGFEYQHREQDLPPRGLPHAEPWVRASDLGELDLHRTLFGVGVPPQEVWGELSHAREEMSICGCPVAVPSIPARALIVALHAAQHQEGKPLYDLDRALAAADEDVWRQATALAERLEAVQNFSRGLRMVPKGGDLADRLGLADAELVEAAIGLGSRAQLAMGFERLDQASGVRAKLRIVARELFPSRDYLRWSSALARRGALGLAAAYAWRPIWLGWHALPSLRAWHGARRRSAARRLT